MIPESQPRRGLARLVGSIASVGGLTLVSRVVGFFRDVVIAAVLGAGPIADAFFVALRLPNHFRAIFGEGAFNAAFVPAFTRVHEQRGMGPAKLFADRIFTLLLATQIVLLVGALLFMPALIRVLAPGFDADPERFALAVTLTRITFPYLLLITLVTLYAAILNALGRFAAANAAPILLNLSIIVALALAAFFPTAGHAAAWGVLVSGVLQFLLVAGDAWRQDALAWLRRPRLDEDTRRFFRVLGPAVIGSAGVQLSVFADTIIASFLPQGALSALYYADRLNQLPIGVIGYAAGVVLLPDMARRIAAGDEAGAQHARNRVIEFALLLALPCMIAFLMVPDLILRALFARGAFTAADAAAAGATLSAYAIGLVPFVLMRSMVNTFHARGDTTTPVKASLTAAAVNIALKVALMGPLAQVGLALATSVGAWLNFALLAWFAARAGLLGIDAMLRAALAKLAVAGIAMAAAVWVAGGVAQRGFAGWPTLGDEIALVVVAAAAAAVYGGAILALFGRTWLAAFRRRKRT
jgi:putative peptidoglycan lipid II flippase